MTHVAPPSKLTAQSNWLSLCSIEALTCSLSFFLSFFLSSFLSFSLFLQACMLRATHHVEACLAERKPDTRRSRLSIFQRPARHQSNVSQMHREGGKLCCCSYKVPITHGEATQHFLWKAVIAHVA
eukprot:s719_g21.t1